jgi:predicted XRE-type DNA-binding protein
MRTQLDKTVHRGSGNVFADLGLPHSEEDMLKVKITHIIDVTIRRRELTQAEAGKAMGIDQGKVSKLVRGHLHGYSVERLMSFLRKLGHDVDITIHKEHAHRQGELRVRELA